MRYLSVYVLAMAVQVASVLLHVLRTPCAAWQQGQLVPTQVPVSADRGRSVDSISSSFLNLHSLTSSSPSPSLASSAGDEPLRCSAPSPPNHSPATTSRDTAATCWRASAPLPPNPGPWSSRNFSTRIESTFSSGGSSRIPLFFWPASCPRAHHSPRKMASAA